MVEGSQKLQEPPKVELFNYSQKFGFELRTHNRKTIRNNSKRTGTETNKFCLTKTNAETGITGILRWKQLPSFNGTIGEFLWRGTNEVRKGSNYGLNGWNCINSIRPT